MRRNSPALCSPRIRDPRQALNMRIECGLLGAAAAIKMLLKYDFLQVLGVQGRSPGCNVFESLAGKRGRWW